MQRELSAKVDQMMEMLQSLSRQNSREWPFSMLEGTVRLLYAQLPSRLRRCQTCTPFRLASSHRRPHRWYVLVFRLYPNNLLTLRTVVYVPAATAHAWVLLPTNANVSASTDPRAPGHALRHPSPSAHPTNPCRGPSGSSNALVVLVFQRLVNAVDAQDYAGPASPLARHAQCDGVLPDAAAPAAAHDGGRHPLAADVLRAPDADAAHDAHAGHPRHAVGHDRVHAARRFPDALCEPRGRAAAAGLCADAGA